MQVLVFNHKLPALREVVALKEVLKVLPQILQDPLKAHLDLFCLF